MVQDGLLPAVLRIEQILLAVAKAQLRPVLECELADEKMSQLYALTGSVTATEATKRLRCSKTTVVEAWRRWEMLGLLVRDGKQYRKVL